jgi:hypothetical protein
VQVEQEQILAQVFQVHQAAEHMLVEEGVELELVELVVQEEQVVEELQQLEHNQEEMQQPIQEVVEVGQ